MIFICSAVSCAVELHDGHFCPVHWCCVPTTLRSALRSPFFDSSSLAGRLALARARLAIAELEDRKSVIAWLSGTVSSLERIAEGAAA